MNESMNESEPKREPTLTELTARHSQLSQTLERHTNARNYLYSALNGDEQPVLTFRPFGTLLHTDQRDKIAVLDLSKLPQDAKELILTIAIEHEERLTFETWAALLEVTNQALNLVQRINAARNAVTPEQIAGAASQSMFPDTIPISRATAPASEVPQGWPGK
jgi:hypothetical protein